MFPPNTWRTTQDRRTRPTSPRPKFEVIVRVRKTGADFRAATGGSGQALQALTLALALAKQNNSEMHMVCFEEAL
jgi:hypothetical protein